MRSCRAKWNVKSHFIFRKVAAQLHAMEVLPSSELHCRFAKGSRNPSLPLYLSAPPCLPPTERLPGLPCRVASLIKM
jgi:hypothetical protein